MNVLSAAMTWWTWLLLGFALLILELMNPSGFFLMFFGLAALIVGVVSGVAPFMPEWAEWSAFAALGIALMLLFRGRLIRSFGNSLEGVDSMIGVSAEIMEPMAPGARGRVVVRGVPWPAVNSGEKELNLGDGCVIEASDGVVLKVK